MASQQPLVCVCFALRGEARPFTKRASNAASISTLLTGMGPANARRSVQRYLDRHRPALLLSCGLAGGLNPSLAHGEVLFESDPEFPLANKLLHLGAQPGRFHTVDHIVVRAAEKQHLRTHTQADAVDMESAPIREICARHAITCATIRVISDTAHEDLPLDLNRWLSADLQLRLAPIALNAAAHPSLIPKLIRLQQQTKRAAAQLAYILAAALQSN